MRRRHPRLSASPARALGRYLLARWPLLAFVAVLTAYRASQWGHFVVPAPDFFDFEDTAQALAAWRLPAQFQRGPLYPALIALVSPLIGGGRPALAAAQGINLVLSAAALLIMYEICALFVGRWAIIVVMLSGLHWTMAYVTVHPLVEPLFLTAILAALYLDSAQRAGQGSPSRRSGKYVAAGLAAAARYEGLFLIAALALCDGVRARRALPVMAIAAAAAAPTLVWLALGALRAGPNPYAAVIAAQPPAGWEFARSMAMSAIGFLPVQALYGALAGSAAWRCAAIAGFVVIAGLMAVGLHRLLRDHRRLAPAVLWFGGFYVAVHVIYPAANTRFVLPVLWLAHLLAVMGAIGAVQWLRAHCPVSRTWQSAAAAMSAGGMGAAAVWAARADRAWILPLALPVAFTLAGARAGALRHLMALPAVAIVVAGALGLSRWYLDREASWWAELTPVAGWCAAPQAGVHHAAPCLAATTPALSLLRELCPHPQVRFYDLGRLDAPPQSGDPSIPAQVTHLLWSSTDTPPAGAEPPMLLSRRYADDRERLLPTGRGFARRVAAGEEQGWRPCARFALHGQRAVIFVRRDAAARLARRSDDRPGPEGWQ